MFWSVDEFCDGFLKLMDHLELDRVSCFIPLPRHFLVNWILCVASCPLCSISIYENFRVSPLELLLIFCSIVS